ncbi:tryptophan-rich sensory protein [Halostella sp. JP-L12]|uniref:TspO/MBR family protein n=1 Tax=Halostella TaxID=1843185 RepID=UPI000EF7A4B4|nr:MULTISPECIES: TspO/MBR family protein [Halostella]NHN46085.1 tryptophan-rich sensory protein [Halostella sp. JP-L12]
MQTRTDAGRSLTRDDVPGLVACVVLVNALGAAPALLGGPNSAWFRSLEKPWFYPPGAAFGIVWPVLFALLGVALYLVWRRGTDRPAVQVALGLFALQFAFNLAWTPAFFTLESLGLAFGIIVALWVLVVATVRAFARVDRRAAALLVPYLLWVTFAAVLNYAILAANG